MITFLKTSIPVYRESFFHVVIWQSKLASSAFCSVILQGLPPGRKGRRGRERLLHHLGSYVLLTFRWFLMTIWNASQFTHHDYFHFMQASQNKLFSCYITDMLDSLCYSGYSYSNKSTWTHLEAKEDKRYDP